ncbi:MAG: four helix bundle protein [Verrucomicrobiales bacterium]|jgi:four helix bundle protein|nr:four helix bundle protein [Verrucomicrobiales bacterium]HQZ27212.1 four helix bundle protein [Verrucomicrobiales bacterium]
MRDHTKLTAFLKSDELVLLIYRATHNFPPEENYGLKSQIRRAAVSVPSNIVEGCSRDGEKEFVRFLDIAFGALRELSYQLNLSMRLGYLTHASYEEIEPLVIETEKILGALIRKIRSS